MKIKKFWTDRSGAATSEFVLLAAALVTGGSVMLITLTTSLEAHAEDIGLQLTLHGCSGLNAPEISSTAGVNSVNCR